MIDVRPLRDRADARKAAARQFFKVVNPLTRWLMSAGLPTGSRNVLLRVLGRRSGKPRTTPMSMIEFDDRLFVQAFHSESGGLRNLRAAGEATVTDHGRDMPVHPAFAILRPVLTYKTRTRGR
jgi:hypothetical protein